MCSIKRKFSIIYKIWPQDCTFFHVKKWMYCNFKFGSSKGACSCFLSFSSQSCRGRAASRPSATARVPPVAAYREISRATALLCPPTRASRSASSPPISPDTPARPTLYRLVLTASHWWTVAKSCLSSSHVAGHQSDTVLTFYFMSAFVFPSLIQSPFGCCRSNSRYIKSAMLRPKAFQKEGGGIEFALNCLHDQHKCFWML